MSSLLSLLAASATAGGVDFIDDMRRDFGLALFPRQATNLQVCREKPLNTRPKNSDIFSHRQTFTGALGGASADPVRFSYFLILMMAVKGNERGENPKKNKAKLVMPRSPIQATPSAPLRSMGIPL